jgi:hypothetical protein
VLCVIASWSNNAAGSNVLPETVAARIENHSPLKGSTTSEAFNRKVFQGDVGLPTIRLLPALLSPSESSIE